MYKNENPNSVRGRIRTLSLGESVDIPRTECSELTVRVTASNLKPCNGNSYKVTRTQQGVRVTRIS